MPDNAVTFEITNASERDVTMLREFITLFTDLARELDLKLMRGGVFGASFDAQGHLQMKPVNSLQFQHN